MFMIRGDTLLLKSKLLLLALPMILLALIAVLSSWGCNPRTDDQGLADGPGMSFEEIEWSTLIDCAICHINENASRSDSSLLASAHASQNVSCVDCHADESKLKTVHNGIDSNRKVPVKLKRTEVSDETCLSCHLTEELVEKTAGCTVLTDEGGLVVNPHLLPENSSHVIVECNNCHVIHTGNDTNESSLARCFDCHHHKIFECYTCH